MTEHLPGEEMSILWGIPFAGLLISIALGPILFPKKWEVWYEEVTAGWAALIVIALLIVFGWKLSLLSLFRMAMTDYVPFILLLTALYTISGGIRLTGSLQGSPPVNLGFLLAGSVFAGWIGTTGASALFIRPLIRANRWRSDCSHVVIFFIFLVGNIGGGLSPLGDPPLFLGFLHGVDFFWPTRHLFLPVLLVSALLLALFYVIDASRFKREPVMARPAEEGEALGLEGGWNFLLLTGVVGSVLMSGVWHPGIDLWIGPVAVSLENAVRNILMVALAIASWMLTPRDLRKRNNFSWHPIEEVAIIFAGIFVTLVPVLAVLEAGEKGAFGAVFRVLAPEGEPIPYRYFWLSGALSSFLDNAPTYLVFFHAAGGAETLLKNSPEILLAISAGTVFMGANTYIGNAPNFLVRSIGEGMGVKMPSFYTYMIRYSIPILLPVFAVFTVLFLW